MKIRLFLLSVVSSFLILTQSGCIVCGLAAAGAAGAGFVAYDRGDLEVTEPISYDDAFNAVDATIQDMGMALVKREKQPLAGWVKAESHYGNVFYSLENRGEKLTTISIRVGNFGDQAIQRQIYAQLKSRYGSGPQVDPETGLPK